jgi:carbamoyltransferase
MEFSMKILGVEAFFHDTSACVLVDGKIKYAVQEERLTRNKRTKSFPIQSVKYCLEENNLSLKDIDIVTFPVNPGIYLEHFNKIQSGMPRYRGEIWYSVLNNLMSLLPNGIFACDATQTVLLDNKTRIKVQYVEHHLAHAALAFYPSDFEEAAILSIDGFGEKDCMLFASGKGNKIKSLYKQEFPHSLGCFYMTITEFLGFQPNSDEWKVMGASSYGDPLVYYDKFLSLFNFNEYGMELDLSYFNFFNFNRPLTYTKKLIDLLGLPRKRYDPITERHFNIAAAAQKVTETVVFKLAENLQKLTKLKSLCFAGGVAMNSVCNGKILKNTSFNEIYIPFAPDDSGGSIGSSLYAYHHINNRSNRSKIVSNYFGPEYSDEEVKKELDKFGLNYDTVENSAKEAAQCIANGEIVGWFQGGVEFGDRALGNRSILADPRKAEMKDILNNKIKFREEFRPFAPSILEEHLNDYFIDAKPTPFMEKVYTIKEEKRSAIPAVVHVDGTGRLQTVNKLNNPLYYSLIENFYKLTDVPVILNTSFNLKDEPIVCSPKDAVRTFFTCGMDALILGNYLLKKSS